mmetsp:Transcript_21072/g.34876  ORF Transcript_21072/g.34876 Transcript_21072/m.34876 type:complete len:198 (+) Transcript_21072:89-682(+)
MKLIQNTLLTYVVLLGNFTVSSTVENDFAMDVFIRDDESYELSPHRRRRQLSSLESSLDTASCEAVSACEVCTTGQRENEPLCKDTGRVQRFNCKPEEGSDPTILFKPCKRTVEDDEFLMMRLQVICFLFGSMSLFAVRKLKNTTSTLFDQRKAAKRGSQTLDDDDDEDIEFEIEFSSMLGQNNNEEMQPLQPIDVV